MTPQVVDVRDEIVVEPAASSAVGHQGAIADTYLARHVAERIAAAIPGARVTEDWWFSGWRVRPPDDRWNLVVDSDENRVTLSGSLPTAELAQLAVETARATEGVRSVRTRLTMSPRE